jgi:hypothetical protein
MPGSEELFRLEEVAFRAGATPGAAGAKAEIGHVNLVVGPNNSGKSLALRELFGWATQGGQPPQPWPGGLVIESATGRWPETVEELEEFLALRAVPVPDDAAAHIIGIHGYPLEQQPGASAGTTGTVHIQRIQPGQDLGEYCRTQAMPHYTARLDGSSRFGLSTPRTLTSLREPPGNHLMAILRDPELFERVDGPIVAAFGLHFVVDMTQPPNLQVALSAAEPPDRWHERLFAEDVIRYQRDATPIMELSDGVKVYTGLVSAVQSLPHRLLLIDEPEAFLHPTLARRLGGELARITRQRNAVLLAATHSPDFLMGCVGEVPETTIIRLTYENQTATTRVLDGSTVSRLVREPLLRAADALSALFARGAVVCEADSDRAFYDEINRRLEGTDGRIGAVDTVFLNAQNWQTTRIVAAPLRAVGIPAAVVLDLDVLLKDEFGQFLSMLGIESAARDALHAERLACRSILQGMGTLGHPPHEIQRCKIDGLGGLTGGDHLRVSTFLDTLGEFGIFPVPVGELEKWLPQFGLTNKQSWVTDMLSRLGNAGGAAYVRPGAGDVWNFVERIAAWVHDPLRKGLA